MTTETIETAEQTTTASSSCPWRYFRIGRAEDPSETPVEGPGVTLEAAVAMARREILGARRAGLETPDDRLITEEGKVVAVVRAQDVLPETTPEQARAELAEAIETAKAETTRPNPKPAEPTRTFRQFTHFRVRGLARPLLRDLADALATVRQTTARAEEFMQECDGAELATVDAIGRAGADADAIIGQVIARLLVHIWTHGESYRETNKLDSLPYKPCGAILDDQWIASVRPGVLRSGEPSYDPEDADVTVINSGELDSDAAVAKLIKTLPRRMVRLNTRVAEVLSREQLAEILG